MKEILKQNITNRFGQVTESVKRLIPIGASSYDEFVSKVYLNKCALVEAKLEIFDESESDSGGDPRFSIPNILGTGYEINYRATTYNKRGIRYKSYYGYIPKSEVMTKEQYDGILLMGLATANQNLRMLQRDFPDIETRLSQIIKNDTRIIDENSRSILDKVEVPEMSFFRNARGSSRFVLKVGEIPNIHILLSEYGDPSGIPLEYFMDKSVSFDQMITNIKTGIKSTLRKIGLKEDRSIS